MVVANGQSLLKFKYNADGIRTSKIINNLAHNYTLNGSQIISESWGNHLIIYLYDESGAPIGLQYRTTNYDPGKFDTYYFEKNIFGDVVGVYTEAGVKIGSYKYDAWGNCTTTVETGNTALQKSVVRNYNPFRYRGYFYDYETGLYYLQSRYYNPATGRFINADGYINANGDLIGFNMYAYCSNNPVMGYDPTGERFLSHLTIKEAGDGRPLNCRPALIYEVPLYKQGSTNLCWAYCDLMMEDYRQNRTSSGREQFIYTRIRAIDTYNSKKGHILPWDHFGSCSAAEEKYHPETITELYDLLKEYGPVYARYVNQFNKGHLIIVTGIDVNKNIVYTNNSHGVRGQQTFEEFQNGICRPGYMPKINKYTLDAILIPELLL